MDELINPQGTERLLAHAFTESSICLMRAWSDVMIPHEIPRGEALARVSWKLSFVIRSFELLFIHSSVALRVVGVWTHLIVLDPVLVGQRVESLFGVPCYSPRLLLDVAFVGRVFCWADELLNNTRKRRSL